MKIVASTLATMSIFALMANAAPIDEPQANSTLEERQAFTWLVMYDDVGFKGKSQGISSDSDGECINLNNNVKDKMSSFILANEFLTHPRACRFYE
ncbi:hypothetical protein LTR84_000313 [Exophiala bonariae]|uniref:Uncharacterized protein n=1 Tax=Exophiala bonariae TaxID=1690606 RepID=A0AAV9NQQ0_9EURO|nr:hypothetical protein LTR84_000313 [Exophiala bonariae]